MGRPAVPVTVLVYDPDHAERYAGLIRAPRGALDVRVASTEAAAGRHIADARVLYSWTLPRELFAKAARLEWVQAMAAGVNWALVPELPAGVVVTRAPGVFGPWMAEYTVGWCLWITQRMERYREAQRAGRWIGEVVPERLAGKTMVLLGTGDIGRTIARAARGMGLRVIGVSRSGRPVPGFQRVYPSAARTKALAQADFAVVALPLTAGTRGVVGAAELAALPRHAWLLNVGRGPVVAEAALVDALRERRLAGVVLDVFWKEPLSADHPLWTMDNVVITPHISGPSTPDELAPIFNDNLARFLAGRRLRHVVDRARGY
jgi:glyoxylate/hydroxypyruvate reductase A